MSCITSLAWVPRGRLKELPDQGWNCPAGQAAGGASGGGSGPAAAAPAAPAAAAAAAAAARAAGNQNDLADFNLDGYDDLEHAHAFTEQLADGDPRIREHSGDDLDDYRFRPTDAVLLVGRTEDELSSLEVHVYAEDTGGLYVHHDITLSAFPLCLEWIGAGSGLAQGGQNFVAVGSFDPAIEVWNLDVLDAFEPSAVLGGVAGTPGTGASSNELVPGSHTDAVLGISWNARHPGTLASCSADGSAKLWDLSRAGASACVATFGELHSAKVQSVAWNPGEGDILATAAFDKTIAVIDARMGLRGSGSSGAATAAAALRFSVFQIIFGAHAEQVCLRDMCCDRH